MKKLQTEYGYVYEAGEVDAEIAKLRGALEDLLPGLELDLRYCSPDDDRDAMVARIRTVRGALTTAK